MNRIGWAGKTGSTPVVVGETGRRAAFVCVTRRYQEDASDGPPVISMLYVQQWVLRKLTGGDLPDR